MPPLILHIDDRDDLPSGTREALAGDGFRVEQTTNPEQAMRLVEEQRPALVVMEVELEGCEGMHLMSCIRDPRLGSVPVLVVTHAPRDSALHGEAIALGVEDFLSKPVRREHLLAAIYEVVSPPGRSAREAPSAPDLSGDLADTPMPELLARLHRRGANGVLAARHGDVGVGVQLRNGSLVGVGSNRGEILAETALYETFGWDSGPFAFSEGRRLESDTLLELPGNTPALLIAGVLEASPPHLVHERLAKREHLYVATTEQSEETLEAAGIELSSEQRRLLDDLGGDDTLSVLLQFECFNEKLVYALWVGGHLELRTTPTLTLTDLLGESGPLEPELEHPEEDASEREQRERELEELARARGERERKLEELARARAERERELEELTRAREKRERELETREQELEALAQRAQELEELARKREQRTRELETLARKREERARELSELGQAREEREREVQELARARERHARELEELAPAVDARSRELKELAGEKEKRARELEELARARAESERELEELARRREERSQELEELARLLDERSQELEELGRVRTERQREIEELVRARAEHTRELDALAKVREESERELEELGRALEERARELDELSRARKQEAQESAPEPAGDGPAPMRRAPVETKSSSKRADPGPKKRAPKRATPLGDPPAPERTAQAPPAAEPKRGEIALVGATPNPKDIDTIAATLRELAERVLAGDDFEVLGISPSATDTEARAAYEDLLAQIPEVENTAANLVHAQRARRIRNRVEASFANLQNEEKRRAYSLLREEEKQDHKTKSSAERALEGERWFHKGKAHLDGRRCQEAVEAFGMALHLDPEQGEYSAHLGYALFLSNPKDDVVQREAMEHVAKGIKRSPQNELSYVYLGRILKAKGNVGVARKLFQKAVSIKPGFHPAVRELRVLEMRERKGKGMLSRLIGR